MTSSHDPIFCCSMAQDSNNIIHITYNTALWLLQMFDFVLMCSNAYFAAFQNCFGLWKQSFLCAHCFLQSFFCFLGGNISECHNCHDTAVNHNAVLPAAYCSSQPHRQEFDPVRILCWNSLEGSLMLRLEARSMQAWDCHRHPPWHMKKACLQ